MQINSSRTAFREIARDEGTTGRKGGGNDLTVRAAYRLPIHRRSAFHGVMGELRCSGGIGKGIVNGDSVSDFEIMVKVLTLHGSDLFL